MSIENRQDADLDDPEDATTDSQCPGHNEPCSRVGSRKCCDSGLSGQYLYCKAYKKSGKVPEWKKGVCGGGKFCYQVTYEPDWHWDCAIGETE